MMMMLMLSLSLSVSPYMYAPRLSGNSALHVDVF